MACLMLGFTSYSSASHDISVQALGSPYLGQRQRAESMGGGTHWFLKRPAHAVGHLHAHSFGQSETCR